MKSPEGTLNLIRPGPELLDANSGNLSLIKVVTGSHIYLLERDPQLNLRFTHSSPSTGTRSAILDLKSLESSEVIGIDLTWSPEKICLYATDVHDPDRHIAVEGTLAPYQLQVCPDGSIMTLGDEGVQVMGTRVIVGGKPLVNTTAINTWRDTVTAIEILLKGSSPDGYIFDTICCCLSIAMLITGFETYGKRRFLELEEEGIHANFEELAKKFISRKDQDNGLREKIAQEAKTSGISPSKILVDRKNINFQNYERCKLAFNKCYGIKFPEDLGVPNETLEELRRIIHARHQIIHVSPLIGVLNEDRLATEKPIFFNKEYTKHAIDVLDGFIQGLHSATLKLRPT